MLVGTGGFLGIGEKDVALSFNDLRFTQRPERQGQGDRQCEPRRRSPRRPITRRWPSRRSPWARTRATARTSPSNARSLRCVAIWSPVCRRAGRALCTPAWRSSAPVWPARRERPACRFRFPARPASSRCDEALGTAPRPNNAVSRCWAPCSRLPTPSPARGFSLSAGCSMKCHDNMASASTAGKLHTNSAPGPMAGSSITKVCWMGKQRI